jgi:phospholipid/cholesterol/gamma-HCH transport system permease protein
MAEQDQVSFQRGDDTTLLVRLSGAWRLRARFPSASLVDRELRAAAQVRGVAFDAQELISWDSSILTFLVELSELCRQRGINMNRSGLPAVLRGVLDIAEAVPDK